MRAEAPDAKAETPAQTALVSLASDVTKQLGPEARGAKVALESMKSDQAIVREGDLTRALLALVSGQLGESPKARTDVRKLVTLKVELVKGELRVTAELQSVATNRWERIKNREVRQVGHAFSSRPIDAEVRSYLAPIVLEQASIHRMKHEETDVLAVACGDLDGDGGNEVLLVSRSRLSLGRFRGGKFVSERTRTWSDVGRRAPVPLGEPIGGAVFEGRHVVAGTSDYGGYRFDVTLKNEGSTQGIPLASAFGDAFCAAPSPEAFGFEGLLHACTKEGTWLLPTTRFDAASGVRIVRQGGKTIEAVAAREANGRLRVRSSQLAAPQALESVGAQVLLADLDLDGTPELVTSAESGDDAAFVYSLREAGLALRRKIPAPAGIRGFAACPAEEAGAPALLMLVASEVWVVR